MELAASNEISITPSSSTLNLPLLSDRVFVQGAIPEAATFREWQAKYRNSILTGKEVDLSAYRSKLHCAQCFYYFMWEAYGRERFQAIAKSSLTPHFEAGLILDQVIHDHGEEGLQHLLRFHHGSIHERNFVLVVIRGEILGFHTVAENPTTDLNIESASPSTPSPVEHRPPGWFRDDTTFTYPIVTQLYQEVCDALAQRVERKERGEQGLSYSTAKNSRRWVRGFLKVANEAYVTEGGSAPSREQFADFLRTNKDQRLIPTYLWSLPQKNRLSASAALNQSIYALVNPPTHRYPVEIEVCEQVLREHTVKLDALVASKRAGQFGLTEGTATNYRLTGRAFVYFAYGEMQKNSSAYQLAGPAGETNFCAFLLTNQKALVDTFRGSDKQMQSRVNNGFYEVMFGNDSHHLPPGVAYLLSGYIGYLVREMHVEPIGRPLLTPIAATDKERIVRTFLHTCHDQILESASDDLNPIGSSEQFVQKMRVTKSQTLLLKKYLKHKPTEKHSISSAVKNHFLPWFNGIGRAMGEAWLPQKVEDPRISYVIDVYSAEICGARNTPLSESSQKAIRAYTRNFLTFAVKKIDRSDPATFLEQLRAHGEDLARQFLWRRVLNEPYVVDKLFLTRSFLPWLLGPGWDTHRLTMLAPAAMGELYRTFVDFAEWMKCRGQLGFLASDWRKMKSIAFRFFGYAFLLSLEFDKSAPRNAMLFAQFISDHKDELLSGLDTWLVKQEYNESSRREFKRRVSKYMLPWLCSDQPITLKPIKFRPRKSSSEPRQRSSCTDQEHFTKPSGRKLPSPPKGPPVVFPAPAVMLAQNRPPPASIPIPAPSVPRPRIHPYVLSLQEVRTLKSPEVAQASWYPPFLRSEKCILATELSQLTPDELSKVRQVFLQSYQTLDLLVGRRQHQGMFTVGQAISLNRSMVHPQEGSIQISTQSGEKYVRISGEAEQLLMSYERAVLRNPRLSTIWNKLGERAPFFLGGSRGVLFPLLTENGGARDIALASPLVTAFNHSNTIMTGLMRECDRPFSELFSLQLPGRFDLRQNEAYFFNGANQRILVEIPSKYEAPLQELYYLLHGGNTNELSLEGHKKRGPVFAFGFHEIVG